MCEFGEENHRNWNGFILVFFSLQKLCSSEVTHYFFFSLSLFGYLRPPGHHAMKADYCGYCFFNNVAVAANHALENLGLSRILIIDWDVHHGQATQQMFYDDPRLAFCIKIFSLTKILLLLAMFDD